MDFSLWLYLLCDHHQVAIFLNLGSLISKIILPLLIGPVQEAFFRCYLTLPNLLFQEENQKRLMEMPRWLEIFPLQHFF